MCYVMLFIIYHMLTHHILTGLANITGNNVHVIGRIKASDGDLGGGDAALGKG